MMEPTDLEERMRIAEHEKQGGEGEEEATDDTHFESIADKVGSGGGGAASSDDKEETAQSWRVNIMNPAAGKSEGRNKKKETSEKSQSKKVQLIQEEKGKEADAARGQGKPGDRSSSYSVGKFEVPVKEVGDLVPDTCKYNYNMKKEEEEGKWEAPTQLEEITRARQTAQQNSIESIKAAEERYSKAKEHAASAVHNTKESVVNLGSAAATYAAHLGVKAKDQTVGGAKSTTQFIAEKSGSVKDTALDSALTGYTTARNTTAEYATRAKDTTAEYAKQGKDYAGEKAVDVKEAVKGAAGYLGEKVVGAKDVAADTAVGAKNIAVDTAVGAKDVAVETGRKGVGMAERATGEAKVVGWSATGYAGEKATEAVKGVAGAVKGVAGYAGETAVAAKDVVVDVTGRVGGCVEEKAAGIGETVKEYGERKKVEAERELDRKKVILK